MKFKILTFLNNLRYLGRYNLKEMDIKHPLSDDELIDEAVYEAQSYEIKKPIIMDVEKSREFLLTSGNSLARYGDGEIVVMGGEGIAFQEYDKRLADRLKEIIRNKQENLSVGLSSFFYYTQNIADIKSALVRRYHRFEALKYRYIMRDFIDFSKPYLNASVSSFSDVAGAMKVRRLWEQPLATIQRIRGGGGIL